LAQAPTSLERELLIEMGAEESSDKKSAGVSSDFLFKLLPYGLIVASYLVGQGRRDSSLEGVEKQLALQQAAIVSLSDRVGTLTEKIARIEGSQESLRREVRDSDQDRPAHK
jgi:hypothetical protein